MKPCHLLGEVSGTCALGREGTEGESERKEESERMRKREIDKREGG